MSFLNLGIGAARQRQGSGRGILVRRAGTIFAVKTPATTICWTWRAVGRPFFKNKPHASMEAVGKENKITALVKKPIELVRDMSLTYKVHGRLEWRPEDAV